MARYFSLEKLMIATPIPPKARPGKASANDVVEEISPSTEAKQMTVPVKMRAKPNPTADAFLFVTVSPPPAY
jgi:hypothetical protein